MKSPKKAPHVWTKQQLALLGKISDGALGKQIGISQPAVYIKRSLEGIPPSRPFNILPWNRQQIALLGKFPDAEVASRLKTSRKVIIDKRHSLGIQSYAISSKFWHQWIPEEIALLGTKRDTEIAAQLGIAPMSVTTKRNHLKIPAFIVRNRTNRRRRSIADWTKKEIALLGKATDKDVADQLNLSPAAVRLKRLSLRIPACGQASRPGNWTPKAIARLGKETDAFIADSIDLTREAVRQKRIKLGIPRCPVK